MAAERRQKQARRKHVPQRTCIICREKQDKRALVRLVRQAEGEVVLDPTGKQNGRGAYICQQATCWETAVARPQLVAQALKTAVTAEMMTALAAER